MDEEAARSTAQLLHDFEASGAGLWWYKGPTSYSNIAGIGLPVRLRAEVVQLIGKIDSTRMTLEELMSGMVHGHFHLPFSPSNPPSAP